MGKGYDLFISYPHADIMRVLPIVEALRTKGLRVWFDENDIADYTSITRAITEGLACSKALLAYYSATYPRRRACQWELTAAFLAAQREGDPRTRVLVVNPELGASHIHPGELKDARFRMVPALGDEAALRELADSISDHVSSLTGLLGDIQPLTPPPWFGMKGVGSIRFVGRFADMWRLHSALHASEAVIITGATRPDVVQVRGLGGIGKSLLAEEYALRFGPAYGSGVFWVCAYGSDGIGARMRSEDWEAERHRQLRDFAVAVGLPVEGLSVAEVEAALARVIERRGLPCLWVVDDIPANLDGQALRRWFAPHPLAKTLLTTRSRHYGALAAALDLDVLDEDEAYTLLTSRRQPTEAAEEAAARGLVRDLGNHPLAVDIAGAALYGAAGLQSFAEFRATLANPTVDELELAEELADTLPNGHEKSIASTLLRSIRHLGSEGQDFLRLASTLAAAPIRVLLVTRVFRETEVLEQDEARRRALRALHQAESLSLAARIEGQEGVRAVHPLVSRTVRFHDPQPQRRAALRAEAVKVLTIVLSLLEEDARHVQQLRDEVVHARDLAGDPADVPEATLLGWVAKFDAIQVDYASAAILYRRQFEVLTRLLGEEHPDTLKALLDLGDTVGALGQFLEAQVLHERVVERARRVFGAEHPNTLTALDHLAATLDAQGQFEKARELSEQVLDGQRRVLGVEHGGTLMAMSGLAGTLLAQGDHPRARALLEEVLAICRRLYGEEDPSTLWAMNNLAQALEKQGDLTGARALQEEVLAGHRHMFGENHPITLTDMNNLGLTLQAQGALDDAQRLFEKAYNGDCHILGENHPQTLVSMNNLALNLFNLGDFAAARTYWEKVLEGQQLVRGEEHPFTLTAMNGLAATAREQGDFLILKGDG
jgi:tetratricopeptide (TPR) repeat protein